MIVGDGDIAKALREVDRDDLLFFASGVSNSKETDSKEFDKERDLLFLNYRHTFRKIEHGVEQQARRLIYFSSLSIFYSDTPYAKHKRKMEEYVKQFERWTIIRLGNIDWGNNPNTIINSMRAQKARGESLDIQDAFRYITNKDEFLYWIKMIPDFNCEMNVPGERMTIKQLVEKYVNT